jgi:23S rRNA pseudouridine2605 synthase
MGFTRNTHITDAGSKEAAKESSGGERIAKVIARAGICSRRDAERLIAEGRVTLNGKKLDNPAVNVTPRDRVAVDGAGLPTAQSVRLWRYHKPKGRVTTHRDPEGRPTVFDALPDDMPRVISIGRLDFNTEGLLLLTNDGTLARHLERPATGWLRRYRVRARGAISQGELDGLKDGIEIEGIRYGPIEAKIDRVQGGNLWLTLGLREGKNREVRRIMEHLKLTVNRLIRLSFGPFALGELAPGTIEEVKRRVLAEQLGAEMAATLGLDSKRQESGGGGSRGGSAGQQPARRPGPAKPGQKPRTAAKRHADEEKRSDTKRRPGEKQRPDEEKRSDARRRPDEKRRPDGKRYAGDGAPTAEKRRPEVKRATVDQRRTDESRRPDAKRIRARPARRRPSS